MWIGRTAIMLFLVFVPGGLAQVLAINGHDLSRVSQLAVSWVCAIGLLIGALCRTRDTMLVDRRVLIGGSLIVLLAIASAVHAPVTVAATRELALALGLAGIAAVVAASRPGREMEWLGVTVVAATALYSALVLLVIGVAVMQVGPLDRAWVIVGYNNYRFFNHAQTVMVPLLLIFCCRSTRGGDLSRLALFGLAMNVALLIFTLGRATAVALTMATLVGLLLFRRAAFEFVRHLSIGVVLGGVVYVGLFVGLPWLAGSSAEALAPQGAASFQSDHSRFLLWRLALDYISSEPWLGIGPMHYAHYVNTKAAHPHNIYLQLASEWGLPFMIAIVGLSAWTMWRMARRIQACAIPEQATMGVGIFVAMLSIAIDGVFSGNFVMPVSQVWIAVAIGWAIAWTRAQPNTSANVPRVRLAYPWRVAFAATLVASQLWLWWSIAPEMLELSHYLDHVRLDLSKTGNLAPRFWSDGWF